MSTRSLLYVPGDRPERFSKAATTGADAIILDLEDAVAPSAKVDARASVSKWLGSDDADVSPQIWVRINNHPSLLREDVAALSGTAITGIVVPKVESVDVLAQVLELADQSDLLLAPLLETAVGILNVVSIAHAPHVSHLMVGETDLGADLGIIDTEALWPIRLQVVVASAAAGIGSPIGPVATNFKDLEALRESSAVFAARGYAGRSCIHPDQVSVVNDVFAPTTEELEWASDVLARFSASDSGICLDSKGHLIDEAVVRAARRITQ